MMSNSDSVLRESSPDDDGYDFSTVAEEVEFLAAIRDAEADVQASRLVSHEEMQNRLNSWLSA